MKNIEEPSADQVKMYLKKRDAQAKCNPWRVYEPQEKCVENFFTEFPRNNNMKDVLAKSYLLNSLYNTRISNEHLNKIAQNIVHIMKDCDQRLNKCDLELVNEIAYVELNEWECRNNFSFATKYCSFHYREKYPIYDRYVDQTLWHFQGKFCKFYRRGLRNYRRFYEVLEKFKEFYMLEEFTWKEIDRYLWLAGRDLKFAN